MMQSYADCWLVHSGWLEKEAWVLTMFLLIKERWPSTKAESNRRDLSGLSGLSIDLLYTGGFRPCNKQCIFFDETRTYWDCEWVVFCIVFQFFKNYCAFWPRLSCSLLQALWYIFLILWGEKVFFTSSHGFIVGLSNKYCSIAHGLLWKHTLIYTCLATCFCTWQAIKAHFFEMPWLSSHCFAIHTRMQLGSSTASLWGGRTLCAGWEEGFDVINIRFQLFHCELSSWVAALTDFSLLMQSHSSLPPHPFPHPLYLLSAHYSSFICLSLLYSIPSLCSHFSSSSSSSHFHLSLHLSPVIIISVIALPLSGGDVFTAASLSNSQMLDYCCMITATIPWWSLLHFAWQCSTLYE